MKRFWILIALCALTLVSPAACAAESVNEDGVNEEGFEGFFEGFYEEMPYFLRFTQNMQEEEVAKDIFIRRTYPDTMNDDVDAQMREAIDAMAERSRPLLPLDKVTVASYLDVGAVVTRTGSSVLSFLALAEVSREKERLSTDFETRVYDIETGRLLSLEDFFAADSGIWALLAQQVRAQLGAAFPGEQPDEQALSQLCEPDSLKKASFTLSAARLTLTYCADAVYAGKNTLLHVHLYYPEIRDMMTQYGRRQTDNARFRMVALTYDDGGARAYTRRVLDELRNYGAQATFFIIGKNIAKNHDILSRQQDSNHSVQSHTYSHQYYYELNRAKAHEEKERLRSELAAVTGVEPAMMRSPGGIDAFYVEKEIGYPIIHWSLASGDSANDDDEGIARRVIHSAEDGDIVLMHDLNKLSHKYTAAILQDFSERGILCVTVEELFADAGVPLEANQIYFSPYRLGE